MSNSIIVMLLVATVILVLIDIVVTATRRTKVETDTSDFNKTLKDEMLINRRENSENAKQAREEIGASIKGFGDSLDKRMETVRSTVEKQLQSIQKDNSEKLEKIRSTVDEQLQSTLEKRLGESFKQVSDRLEQVHKGLGEMQTLATGVGDLKKVLANVKTRGTWGEIQLGNLLDQILTSDQYEKNAQVSPRSQERVEYAIRIPSKSDDSKIVLLPIDSKFPIADYQNLIDSQESGDSERVLVATKQLERSIKTEAKRICDKYIKPPKTTDFGILYLANEGLYAEVTQKQGLIESLQTQCRVIVGGPSTMAALLNSLQMGFRTLAIEKQTSAVWSLLDAVRIDFGKFGEILDRTHKKLVEASNTIEKASQKSRTLESKLNKVQKLPRPETEESELGELEPTDTEE